MEKTDRRRKPFSQSKLIPSSHEAFTYLQHMPQSGLSGWIAPGFDPIKLGNDFTEQINNESGGHLEQSYFYLDLLSAIDWYGIANQTSYVMGQQGFPYYELTKAIKQCLRRRENQHFLQIIALGSGDAKKELRLVQHLLEEIPGIKIHLILLDICQPLLANAYQYVTENLQGEPRILVSTLQGDMYQLHKYMQSSTDSSSDHLRLVTLLGYTLGALDNEPLFLRQSLQNFTNGDMVLLDVATYQEPTQDHERIQKTDARLSKRLPPGWEEAYKQFLSGPIHRYRSLNTRLLDFSYTLDYSTCTVSNSYAVNMKAWIHSSTQEKIAFSVMRFKRYEADSLIEAVQKEGWAPFMGWTYGLKKDALLYLWRKEQC